MTAYTATKEMVLAKASDGVENDGGGVKKNKKTQGRGVEEEYTK